MFENIQPAPPDAILGITEAFGKDTNPSKINLSVGVYKDAGGTTPILESVKAAERALLDSEKSKGYKPIPGAPEYAAAVQALMFGGDHEIISNGRAETSHTPGGTGALRVAGDYLKQNHPDATLWLSDPTWANHGAIFASAGVPTKTYAYFDREKSALAFDAMMAAIDEIPAGDVILLHGCCHNPTGQDPTIEQWAQIADVLAQRNIVPLLDFAYQGFAIGIDEDAAGLRAILDRCREAFVCSSFSKNFGLYCERVGALTVVADTHAQAAAVQSHIKRAIRTNYSNPPAHGAGIVTTILNDANLRKQWVGELTAMRDRINGIRELFVKTLGDKGVTLPTGDNSFITRQNGMFSFSGLSKDQVEKLRAEHSIYIVGSGRINVAGMTEANMDQLCEAIKTVV